MCAAVDVVQGPSIRDMLPVMQKSGAKIITMGVAFLATVAMLDVVNATTALDCHVTQTTVAYENGDAECIKLAARAGSAQGAPMACPVGFQDEIDTMYAACGGLKFFDENQHPTFKSHFEACGCSGATQV